MNLQRVGIDARMLCVNPSGVGNYISQLLGPMCTAHPQTEFFLYSNSTIEFPGFSNVRTRQGGSRVGPAWLNADVVKSAKQDRIEVFWGANGIAPVRGAVPTVLTVHDMVYRFAGQTMGAGARWTKRVFQGWSARRARQVIAVSNATAADVLKIYGRAVDDVIPPMAHPSFRRHPAQEIEAILLRHKLPPIYWLFAGTLEPRKNLVSFLSAYLKVLSTGVDLPVLALAGNVGWATERLNELIGQGEALGQVRRLGYVPIDELACLYGGTALLWMPSLYEGFGMPLLEAQRCGAPVAHGDHPSMSEASGGLGVRTATDEAALASTIESVARGEAPLVCRLEQMAAGEAKQASERLWDSFCVAAAGRS